MENSKDIITIGRPPRTKKRRMPERAKEDMWINGKEYKKGILIPDTPEMIAARKPSKKWSGGDWYKRMVSLSARHRAIARRRVYKGETCRQVAEHFGMHRQSVQNICLNPLMKDYMAELVVRMENAADAAMRDLEQFATVAVENVYEDLTVPVKTLEGRRLRAVVSRDVLDRVGVTRAKSEAKGDTHVENLQVNISEMSIEKVEELINSRMARVAGMRKE